MNAQPLAIDDPVIHEPRPDDVPETACTNCPKKRFALTRIRVNCIPCPFFGGLIVVPGNEALPFDRRYQVHCSHVIGRSVTMVD